MVFRGARLRSNAPGNFSEKAWNFHCRGLSGKLSSCELRAEITVIRFSTSSTPGINF